MRRHLLAAALFLSLTACPGPIANIPPPSPIGVEAALNGAILAEGKVRGTRCPRNAIQRGVLTGARLAVDSRYGPYFTADQRERLDQARRDTDEQCRGT